MNPAAAPDPFDTAAVRAATLESWRSSPTRLAEDIAAETDLVTVGYRDRLLTELAANAADAAAVAGEPGELAVWLSGRELHVANTGAPLTVEGVRSLSALRVSAKPTTAVAEGNSRQVGRFGVGFTATAVVADRVEMRSTTGSVVFDRALTEEVIREAGARLADSVEVPLLRLPWPSDVRPRKGFDTEVVLYLRDGSDNLVAPMISEASDLLLELPSLQRISVGEVEFGVDRHRLPELSSDGAVVTRIAPTRDGVQSAAWLQVATGTTRWLAPVDGPTVAGHDVLRAPTPTGIELSLPCRLIADLPLTPDRRNLHPSADIASAAVGYADLIRLFGPRRRLRLVPEPHLARNRDDARLIDAVLADLRRTSWLPAADGADLVPSRSVVLVGLTAELADVLGDLFGDLVHPDISDAGSTSVLGRLGVVELGLAGLADRLTGVERPSQWWQRLYAALAPLVGTGREVEEIAALPVPRSDGRMAVGARGLFVSDRITGAARWLPMVDRQARHPLVERMGAQELTVEQALSDPALRQLIEDADLDSDGGLADEVLALVAADPDAALPAWLAQLPLPDADGEWRPADELLLPDSPLGAVLVDDHPFGVVDRELTQRHGASTLRRVGVGWGFLVVSDELPTAPDHDLPDEELWWDSLTELPESLSAVGDLDLVDEQRWAAALTLLADDEEIVELLGDRDGYTAWWLRRCAIIDGHPLGDYRAPSDETLVGVLDPLDHPQADAVAGALAELPPASAAEASRLLDRLGDPDREVSAGVAVSVHASIVGACRSGVIDPADIDLPDRVRTLAATAVADAVVLDKPYLLQMVSGESVVLAGTAAEAADAETLGVVLDLPLASEAFAAEIRDPGDAVTWSHPEAVRFAAQRGVEVRHGEVRVHDELWVTLRRNDSVIESRVGWWIDHQGVTHLERAGH
uniref:sacsin N-terminal ATP-binding-like domain-containing protein n=1 Tax=Gordonia sp. B7-2 TaxID=3420932 RepID=UPI003D8D1F9A